MTHKVYAFVNKQPYGLVEKFSTRIEAKACANNVEKHGIKVLGEIVPATAKIVLL